MASVITGKAENVNESEALRFLGYGKKNVPAEEVWALLCECEREVLEAQDLKACFARFDIDLQGENIDLGFAKVKSKSLALNLAGCKKIVLFACTAGAKIDRLIAKYTRIAPSKAAVIQAMGAALVEGWCNALCDKFKREYGETKPRFSCGYGDLDLRLQRDIFAALSVTKHLGITLSDDCFMTPTKSVTAIVGIKDNYDFKN